MTTWGYTLSSEEFAPGELVELSGLAEDAGFEFVTVSDHYLWTGETVDHRGEHFTVENARIFTTPPAEIPVIAAASGEASAARARSTVRSPCATAPIGTRR